MCYQKGLRLKCHWVRALTSSALADGGCWGNCLAVKCAVQNCTTLCGSCKPLNLISPMCDMCNCKPSSRSGHAKTSFLYGNNAHHNTAYVFDPFTYSLSHPFIHILTTSFIHPSTHSCIPLFIHYANEGRPDQGLVVRLAVISGGAHMSPKGSRARHAL